MIRIIKNRILIYLVLPIIDLITGSKILHYYLLIKKLNKSSKIEIIKWQNRKLKEIVLHAYYQTKYYKNLFDKSKINPNNITIDNLNSIPILTKKNIIENFNDLVPSNISKIKYKKASTGGSTGDPLVFYNDLNSISFTTANKIINWQKSDYLYGDKYLALGSSSLFPTNKKSFKHKLYYFIRGGIPFNAMNMSDKKIQEILKIILKKKINYIYGYASAIYLLAKYVVKNNIKIKILACFPTSEVLTELYRKTILDAFNCKIINSYGARDGGITAFEIEQARFQIGYNSIAKIKNSNKNDQGELLVTDLLNFSLPFINYQIGDNVSIYNSESNSNGQVFSTINGRTSDIIHLKNGNIITGPGFTILFKDLNVIAYKIIKIDPLKLKIEILPNINFEKSEEQLIYNTFKKHAGKECDIIIEYVDKFKTSNSGKKQYFIN